MTVGIDIKLTQIDNGLFDITIDDNGDIESEDSFDTAILMSLFCERRAAPYEVAESSRRRGWIGNEYTPGFEIGSKLWLYEQPRFDQNTFRGINLAVEECLQWMIDDGYAKSIRSEIQPTDEQSIILTIHFTRPNSEVEQFQYELWNNTGTA